MDAEAEQTPLLQNSQRSSSPEALADIAGALGQSAARRHLRELRQLFSLAWPIVLSQFFQNLLGPVAIIFCGHLGKTQLDGVALACSMINVTGLSIGVGLTSACDTLFAQTFGSRDKHQLGLALQRSVLIAALAVLPCWAIHLNIEALLRAIGQEQEVSRLAGEFVFIMIPGVLGNFMYNVLSKYIQAQNIVIPLMVLCFLVNLLHVLLQYVFVYVLEKGTNGSAVAMSISNVLLALVTWAYILCSGLHKDTWSGWSRESLLFWKEFLQLGVPGLFMVCIEWWSFEIGIILTGLLGTTELGAQSVLFQLEVFAYMLPLGLGISASIRVGNSLGAGHAERARLTGRTSIFLAAVVGLVLAIFYFSLRNILPTIFTNVREVIDLCAAILPIICIYLVFDCISGVCAGILRGCGRQAVGALIILAGYAGGLAIGIPLMFLSHFKSMGFWIGLAVALLFEAVAFCAICFATKWDQQVEVCRRRLQKAKESRGDGRSRTFSSSHVFSGRWCNSTGAATLERNSFDATKASETVGDAPSGAALRRLLAARAGALVASLLVLVAGILLRVCYRPAT